MKKYDYDLIIVGAGIVGLCLAAALDQTDLKILLLDKNPFIDFNLKNNYDLRVSAINRNSETLFNRMGIWQDIKTHRASSFRHMIVWDKHANLQFNAEDIAYFHLGHIVEHQVLKYSLLQKLKLAKQIHLKEAITIETVNITDSQVHVQTPHHSFKTKLLIGADGSHSWLRDHLGFKLDENSYQHNALICTVNTEKTHKNTAYQCFTDGTILAFLPLKDKQTCSIVWSAPTEKIQALLALDETAFNQKLAKNLDFKLGKVNLISPRVEFPLAQRHVNSYIQTRTALIGDAAHTIHPLAGLGLNLGLADVACLAEILKKTNAAQRDIGLQPYLRQYQRQRYPENQLFINSIGKLKHLFSSKTWPIELMRQFALLATNQIQPLKQAFIHAAQM
ncbi:MAG: FAD-dependent monooxygenase [Pseudomonadota bacterium]